MTRRHQAGFTLVEVVITFAVISIAVVPISAAIVHGYSLSSQAACLTQAAFLARHLAEEVMAAKLGPLRSAAHLAQYSPLPLAGHERFSYTRVLQEVSFGLLRLEVCVSWHGLGQVQHYRLVTLLD